VGAHDLDGDLLPELYIGNDFGPDRLLHNESTPGHVRLRLAEGSRSPTTPSSKVLGHDSFKGMGVDFGDLNSDGVPDIFVSNITNHNGLLESNFMFVSRDGDAAAVQRDLARGSAPWSDRSEPLGLSRSGWAWDAKLADFDGDGTLEAVQALGFVQGDTNRWADLQELAMANDQLLDNPANWPRFQAGTDLAGHQRIPFFVRSASGRYVDVGRDVGLDSTAVTRGIAIGDADGDGALDFVAARQWDAPAFYHNDRPRPGAFLGLRLSRPASPPGPARATSGRGSPAIGAEVTVVTPDGRRLVDQVDGGSGHSGKRGPEVVFGLGRAGGLLRVELRWRDAGGHTRQAVTELAPGWHDIRLDATAEEVSAR
jgi:hypothetical protein